MGGMAYPPPLNPPLPEGTPVPQHWMTLYLQRVWVFKAALFISDFIIIIIVIIFFFLNPRYLFPREVVIIIIII